MRAALTEMQRIPTSGARAVEAFTVDGLELLAIPQLARDVPGAAVTFIKTGQPGWQPYNPPERHVRVYDTPSSVQPDGYADVAVLSRPAAHP